MDARPLLELTPGSAHARRAHGAGAARYLRLDDDRGLTRNCWNGHALADRHGSCRFLATRKGVGRSRFGNGCNRPHKGLKRLLVKLDMCLRHVRVLRQPIHLCDGGLLGLLRQAGRCDGAGIGEAAANRLRPTLEQDAVHCHQHLSHGLPDSPVACLCLFVPLHGRPATDIQGEMLALHVWVGVKLLQYFRGQVMVIGNALVKADPQVVFL